MRRLCRPCTLAPLARADALAGAADEALAPHEIVTTWAPCACAARQPSGVGVVIAVTSERRWDELRALTHGGEVVCHVRYLATPRHPLVTRDRPLLLFLTGAGWDDLPARHASLVPRDCDVRRGRRVGPVAVQRHGKASDSGSAGSHCLQLGLELCLYVVVLAFVVLAFRYVLK